MFSKFLLKKVGIFILISFVFLIGTSEYSFANEEDILLKARKYYQQGNYDESVKVLQKFIENLRAIVEQKKNVAEAFYLLAKVYYTVGEDAEVNKNLKKVYETFPSFSKEEDDLEFKKIILQVRKEMGLKEVVQKPIKKIEQQKPMKKVIVKEGKKKKKFPILLVAGGIIIIAAVAILLLKKKEEVYDIRGRWNVHESIPADGNIFDEPIEDDLWFSFTGQLDKGTFVDMYGDAGVYLVQGKEVTIRYTDLDPRVTIRLVGNFSSTTNMGGDIIVNVGTYNAGGTWNGAKTSANVTNGSNSTNRHNTLVEKLRNIR